MITFAQLVVRHDEVKWIFGDDSKRVGDFGSARAVWESITGRDMDPTPGSPAEAARDTMPVELAPMMATIQGAAAAAWVRLYTTSAGAWFRPTSPLDLRDAARRGWQAFKERAAEVEKIQRGFGWDLSETWGSEQDFGSCRAVNVERVAELAGRMFACLKGAAARQVSGIVGELYSVELGDDLSRMLPVERMGLADPLLELALFERIDGRKLQQYSVRSESPASRGPLVLCLDESGSMHDQRRVWSKAAALAVARVAHSDKRPIVVVHYTTERVVRELDPSNPADVLAMLRSFLDGGNDTPPALLEARSQVVSLARRGDVGADVMLITDGVEETETATARAIDALHDVGARLWTIAIDCDIAPTRALRARAAGYHHVDARGITPDDSAAALLGGVRPSPIRRRAA